MSLIGSKCAIMPSKLLVVSVLITLLNDSVVAQRADVIALIGRSALRYCKLKGIEKANEVLFALQPLRNFSQPISSSKVVGRVYEFDLVDLKIDMNASDIDFKEDHLSITVAIEKAKLTGKFFMLSGLFLNEGPAHFHLEKGLLNITLNIGTSPDELIPFLQSDPACEFRADDVHITIVPYCAQGAWYEKLFDFRCWGPTSPEGPFAFITSRVIQIIAGAEGRKVLEKEFAPLVCKFISSELKSKFNALLQEAKTALANASIAIPIARGVTVGISQRGIRSVRDGVIAVPLSLNFRYGSPEMAEKAKVISRALGQCPAPASATTANTMARMLSLVFMSTFVQHLLGVIAAVEKRVSLRQDARTMNHNLNLGPVCTVAEFPSFNGTTAEVGKFLQINNCSQTACLPSLLGLDPDSDPRLKRAKAGLECKISGDLENVNEICASKFRTLDNGVIAVLPLDIHCTAKLEDPNEVLEVLRTGVVVTANISDIRMEASVYYEDIYKNGSTEVMQTVTRIFVDEDAEIKLDVAFKNSRLLYNSTSPDFSPPGDVTVPLRMAWDFAKAIVVKFVKKELTKGIEIRDLRPLVIIEASILTGEKALANGDDVITASAHIGLYLI